MMPLSTCIIPKFCLVREGGHATVTGVIAWGLRKSCKIETSWSPVGSLVRPLASLCVLTIPICTSNKQEPKNLNPTSYQVVPHFTWGREGVPYPTRINKLCIIKFCVLDALSSLVNLFYLLGTSYTWLQNIELTLLHAHAHITNTDVPVMWCAKIQNKHELLTRIQCETLLEKH